VYAHVPLVLGPDGARLAKRHGAVTLADRAQLGQSPSDVRRELLTPFGLAGSATMQELVEHFDPQAIR
jgi:glutamyl-tRNA synthetase